MPDDLDFGATLRGHSPGQKVFGRYTLRKILGRGGMGIVWLAHDEDLEREIALKFLPEVVAADPQSIRDLKRETRRSLELTYPNIIRIYDFVKDDTTAAISMEYVEGKTMAELKLAQASDFFETVDIEKWIQQLCDALAYAHGSAQVVHRDLKPANLMVDARGELKVADFGIAASVSDSVSRVSVQAGSSGTPVYMSPQQMMGEPPAVTDDIYAFGATVFELITGRPPFYSGNVMMQVMNKVPPSMTKRREELGVSGTAIPGHWEETVAACLAKEPGDRPKDMLALKRALVGSAESAEDQSSGQQMGGAFSGFNAGADVFEQIFGTAKAGEDSDGDLQMRIRMAVDDMKNGGRFEVPIQRNGKSEKVEVTIPSNVEVGTKVRLAGMGDQKKSGEGAGDLYLVLEEPDTTADDSGNAPPALPKSERKKRKKGVTVLRVIAGISIFILLAIGGFFLYIYLEVQREDKAYAAAVALKLSDGILEVPGEYSTIDSAIWLADEGMTVRLAPGVYEEKINLTRRVNIEGSGDEGATVIEVEGTETALSVNGVETVSISNLTFRHSSKNEQDTRAPLISLNDAKVRFHNNRIESAGGYGVSIRNGGESEVEDNVITGAAWGGILVYDQGIGSIRNNLIESNEGKGIEIRDNGEPLLISRNQIMNNGSNGIWVKSTASMRIIGNTLEGNGRVIPNTGGIGIAEEGKPTLVANIAKNNNGDGIWWRDDSAPMIGADNVSDGEPVENNL